jgi:hypothetical protein
VLWGPGRQEAWHTDQHRVRPAGKVEGIPGLEEGGQGRAHHGKSVPRAQRPALTVWPQASGSVSGRLAHSAPSICIYFIYLSLFFAVPGIEPRALHRLGRCSAT